MSRPANGWKLDKEWRPLMDVLPIGSRVTLSVRVGEQASVTAYLPDRDGGGYLASAIEETPARALAVLMEQLPDESQGAAAAVLFIVLPGEMSDEERAAHIERGRQLVAEHPEWLAPQAPSNVWGLPGFGEGMERARQDFEAGRVEPVHTRLKHEHSK